MLIFLVIGIALLFILLICLAASAGQQDSEALSQAEQAEVGAARMQYREWKSQASSWEDIEMLNDMIEEEPQRVRERRRRR